MYKLPILKCLNQKITVTEISPKHQSMNAETMPIERVRECNQSVRTIDNYDKIQHENETNNSIDLSGDDYLTAI